MQDSALAVDEFVNRLTHYGQWKTKLLAAIEAYRQWYDQNQDPDSDEELRLYELIEELHNDTLNVALVGEFSRGKTELINAVFFADYKRRLLPSTPGRTTMCPTEILYDERLDPCIRLLPIESRKSALSIAELKKTRINWTTLPLNLDSADEMADTLQEILRCKKVTTTVARELGLLGMVGDGAEQNGTAVIPTWRHAVINFPHPLLKQGLAVLDTPGLNALGAEPELTLSMLPKAHAVVFVLAADTGVTKTDIEVWKNHVCVATHGVSGSLTAVLNKIDTLWDDLQNQKEIDGFVNRQVEETRRLLNLGPGSVFPVSAQKGLLGKIRNDADLVARSRLPELESKLSSDIVVFKQKLICEKIAAEIGTVVSASRGLVYGRRERLDREIDEIRLLRDRSGDVIEDMTYKLRKQKDIYEKEVQSFQVTRRLLADQVRDLLAQLNLAHFDQLIAKTRLAMHNSWTTQGLRQGMQTFFGGTFHDLKTVEQKSEEIRHLVEDIYARFHSEHGLPRMQPAKFAASTFRRRYQLLYDEAERFRNSPAMIVTEQHFVVKKFFITMVSRARAVFQDCNASARNWAKAVLNPIYTQIQEHKVMIDRRLENLEKLRGNHASLGDRVRDIERERHSLDQQAAVIDSILRGIEYPETD